MDSMKNRLQNGDIVLVNGVAGIFYNGQTTLSNLTVTDEEPDYVLRFDGQITEEPERLQMPVLEFGTSGLNVAIMQCCLKWHGIPVEIDGVLGVKSLAALREFRKQHYLTGDTICDTPTWQLLLTE